MLEDEHAESEALAAQSKLRGRALTGAHAEMERMNHTHAEEKDRLRELLRHARDEMVRAACDQLRRAEETFRLQQQIDELLLCSVGTKVRAEACVDRECPICMESVPNMAFPCGHVAVCEMCSASHTIQDCPVCRHPGGPQLRIYLL